MGTPHIKARAALKTKRSVVHEPAFPPAITLNGGRLFFDRHLLENYKRALIGEEPLPRDEKPIELVPATQAAGELGFGRVTLGRRLRKVA